MRISSSEGYGHAFGSCGLDPCDRHYCDVHRHLWRDCDTAKKGMDDTDNNGRAHLIFDLGDCPHCEAEFRRRLLYLKLVRLYPHDSVCPDCFSIFNDHADTTMHLIRAHAWDGEHARLWLRDRIESR